MYLAAKRTSFCCKQPKIWCKLRFYAMHIHFACIYMQPLFASKQTFARIDFLRSDGRFVNYEGTLSVKNLAEKFTIVDELTS